MKESNNKISIKDIIIIGLTVVALVLLFLIVYIARKNDRIVTETLSESEVNETESGNTSEKKEEGVIQSNLLFTEANGDKWIEVYNNSNADFDISGYTVYISGEKVCDIADETKVVKNEFFVIELSKNPGVNDENLLCIRNKNDEDVISMLIPKLDAGQSYGRRLKSSNDLGYVSVSKGTENTDPDNYKMIEYGGIGLSSPSGFYNSEFSLTLEKEEGETIYYTIDGTAPTTESSVYESPINIKNMSGGLYVYASMALTDESASSYRPNSVDKGVVLRAIKVDSSGKKIGETTQAYYIGLLRKSDYLKLPVLSIVAEPNDLFDYFEGIYVGGRVREDGITQGRNWDGNYRRGWTKKAAIEFFEPGKGKSFESQVELSIDGDDYKGFRQKGFKLAITEDSVYKDYAGSSILESLDDGNNLRLHTHLNDSDLKIRDYVINSLIEDSNVANHEIVPCIVFLNGEYWGLYSFLNSWDQKYIKSKYDIDDPMVTYNANDYSEDFDELYKYVVLNDMSDNDNYNALKNMIDIDSYLQYMCFNIYVGNYTYNSKTGYAWKTIGKGNGKYNDGKWRWGIQSMDLTMGFSAESSYSIDTFLFPNYANDPFFNSLLMNKEFCKSFSTTMDKVASEYFNEEKYSEVIDDYSALLKKAIIASRNRFYGGYNDSTFATGIDTIKTYLDNRYYYISIYTKEVVEKGGDIAVIQAERDKINEAAGVAEVQE